MGAYLSSPIREKVSEDDERSHIRFGASSMQGWRMSQEDAHNCCPDFDQDTNTSLFACYDGHGGAEVAQYTAKKMPDFIKSMPLYMEGKLSEALEEGFLEFDETLTKEDVIQKLKELACIEEDGEQDEGEAKTLYEEATMPLEELLERYGRGGARNKLSTKDSTLQSPAVRPKKESHLGDEVSEKDDVKVKLDNELMNGHGEGENGLETVTSLVDSGEHQPNEAQAKEECDSIQSTAASVEGGSSCVDSTTADEPPKEAPDCEAGNKENVAESNQASSTASSDSPLPPAPSTASSSSADGARETEKPSSTSSSAQDSQSKEASGSGDLPSSSGSCGVGSTSNAGGSGVGSSSSAEASGSAGCAGGSSSNSVGSSGTSAGGSGSSSSDTGPCSSSKEEEPQAGSSSGRVRHKRKNIIPEEGEDESSFDEDSEDDSSGDEDEPRPWASGSDDSSEEDEGMPESEEDEDEDEGCGEMGSGEPGSDSGCTAVVCLLRGRELYVANSGDSRCVVCRGGKAMDMSVDHKPEDEIEHKRVTKAGGRVTLDGRVNGGLNMSRAIGDHCYKQNNDLPAREQMITALPDVRSTTLEDRDTFMVLACDGIWNVMSSQDVVNFVSERLKGGATKLSAICEEMFDYCLAPDTTGDGTGCDNMTCIIVTFNHDGLDAMGSASTKKRLASDSQDTPDLPDTKKQKTEETAS